MLMTIRAFCSAYCVGRTLAYELIKDGAIEAIKIGSATRITSASAAAWAAMLKRVNPKDPPGSP